MADPAIDPARTKHVDAATALQQTPKTFPEFSAPIMSQIAQYKSGVAPTPASGPKKVSVGQVVDGHRFKGGDPSKATSWEAVQVIGQHGRQILQAGVFAISAQCVVSARHHHAPA